MSDLARWLVIGFLALAAVGVAWYRHKTFQAPPPAIRPSIVVVTGGNGPYWQLMADGARAAAKDCEADVKVLLPEHDEDFESQMRLLASINPAEVQGIALSPLDAEQQTRLINTLAQEAYVVTIDSDAPLSNRIAYIGASNYAAGVQCGRLVKESLPTGGKIFVLAANRTKDNVLERLRGLEDQLAMTAGGETSEPQADPPYSIAATLVDGGDRKKCRKQLVEALGSHEEVAGLVGLNSHHGAEIIKALEETGQLDKIKVVAFDTEKGTLAGVQEGHIYAAIAQDPYHYGYEAVRSLAHYARRRDNQLPLVGVQSTVTISTKVVQQGDVEALQKELEQHLHKP